MVTAIVAVVMYPEAWEPKSIVMTVCVVTMSLFILVLEGRFISPSPLSARAHLRNIMTRNFNILRFVWGRGILYVSAGTINVAQTWLITMISGAVMIVLGILAIILGIHASRKFASLRNSLADESFLLLLFSYYDGDGDGFLEVHQFTSLLSYLGMELDDRYALKAFDTIDRDGDRRISFDEFNHWWTSGYIERGRKALPAEYDHDERP
jgi:EF-hand domain pair